MAESQTTTALHGLLVRFPFGRFLGATVVTTGRREIRCRGTEGVGLAMLPSGPLLLGEAFRIYLVGGISGWA